MAISQVAISSPPARSSPGILARISAMMFLQYWPLGTWGVTFGTYIFANSGDQGSRIFSPGFAGYSTSASAFGSLLSPVVVGFLSDRYFAAQYLVALLHAGCAIAAWGMYQSDSQIGFFLSLAMYFQCFGPAAALTNKIGLKHLTNATAEYPFVRIFSTVGWITAGLFVGFVWPLVTGKSIEPTRIPLLIGAAGSAAMALYSLTLPRTPPEEQTGLFLSRIIKDSRELLRNRALILFLFVSMLACIPTMAYNNFANPYLNRLNYARPAALMTLGQVSDLIVLGLSPWLIRRVGLRALFAVGIVAWGLRHGLLAIGHYFDVSTPVIAAIVLNGACFVFIYVVGVMYVDELVGGKHRGVAQGMFSFASTGLANLFGAISVGFLQATFLIPPGVSPSPYRWTEFWIVPALISVVAFIVFTITFRPQIAQSADG